MKSLFQQIEKNHLIELYIEEMKYDDNTIFIDMAFNIHEGEFISIIGRSGSGKSTFLNILGTLETNYIGKYKLKDLDVSNLSDNERAEIRKNKIGFIFQNSNLINDLTVYENIILPFLYNKTRIDKEYLILLSDMLEISHLLQRKVNLLSGGEAQRASILRALITKPTIILADEPTGSVDKVTEKSIMNVLVELNNLGNTIILITHSMSLALLTKKIYEIENCSLKEKINYDRV